MVLHLNFLSTRGIKNDSVNRIHERKRGRMEIYNYSILWTMAVKLDWAIIDFVDRFIFTNNDIYALVLLPRT